MNSHQNHSCLSFPLQLMMIISYNYSMSILISRKIDMGDMGVS